jgi:hypothetical protein
MAKAKIALYALVVCLACGQYKQDVDTTIHKADSLQVQLRPSLQLKDSTKAITDTEIVSEGTDSIQNTLKKKDISALSASPPEKKVSVPDTILMPKKVIKKVVKETNMALVPQVKESPEVPVPSAPAIVKPENSIKDKKTKFKTIDDKYEGLKNRSLRYYQIASGFLGNKDDSSLIYINKAIEAFENGSLFRVKAQALYNLKFYSDARIACDICLSRDDYWEAIDIKKALKLKCDCFRKIYEQFPSTESRKNYEAACKNAGIAVIK